MLTIFFPKQENPKCGSIINATIHMKNRTTIPFRKGKQYIDVVIPLILVIF